MRRSTRFVPLFAGALLLSGCVGPPDDQRTDSVDPETAGRADLSEVSMARLDSGNVAFRAGDLEAALAHYTAVSLDSPESPSGWFGLYMVHQQLGDVDAAEAALERARDLAPGASLIRDTTGAGGDA